MHHRSDHPSRSSSGHPAGHRSRPSSRRTSTASIGGRPPTLVIACDDCAMQHTSACDDCLVTFVCSDHERGVSPSALELDAAEIVAVGRLARAGLVPALRHEAAVP